jgi:hypothetical protein
MQLTPIRRRTGVVTATLVVPLLLVLTTGACGQVTGLSNDYLFDLQNDGGGVDAKGDASASADGPKGDAIADASGDRAAPKCSLAQATSAQVRMSQMNGLMECKDCLANNCCTDVEACASATECRRAFACRLDCTTLTGSDRHDCYNACMNGGGNATPASWTSGVDACSKSSCDAICAFL